MLHQSLQTFFFVFYILFLVHKNNILITAQTTLPTSLPSAANSAPTLAKTPEPTAIPTFKPSQWFDLKKVSGFRPGNDPDKIETSAQKKKLDVLNYPHKTIQCISSLTKPDQVLICPAARYVSQWGWV